MMIKAKGKAPEDIEAYIARSLGNDNYYCSPSEATETTVDKTVEAIGRLMKVLHRNGVLTLSDVSFVAVGYDEGLEEA